METFLTLKLFILILCLTLLRYNFNINKEFAKSLGTMLGTFIPTIIILVFLSSYFFIFMDDKDHSIIFSII